jgi:hypothetical protein
MINPTDKDVKQKRRVILRKEEDRGVIVGFNFGDFGSDVCNKALIHYDSDDKVLTSYYTDLQWEDSQKESH